MEPSDATDVGILTVAFRSGSSEPVFGDRVRGALQQRLHYESQLSGQVLHGRRMPLVGARPAPAGDPHHAPGLRAGRETRRPVLRLLGGRVRRPDVLPPPLRLPENRVRLLRRPATATTTCDCYDYLEVASGDRTFFRDCCDDPRLLRLRGGRVRRPNVLPRLRGTGTADRRRRHILQSRDRDVQDRTDQPHSTRVSTPLRRYCVLAGVSLKIILGGTVGEDDEGVAWGGAVVY